MPAKLLDPVNASLWERVAHPLAARGLKGRVNRAAYPFPTRTSPVTFPHLPICLRSLDKTAHARLSASLLGRPTYGRRYANVRDPDVIFVPPGAPRVKEL